jgi:hypothetical protein
MDLREIKRRSKNLPKQVGDTLRKRLNRQFWKENEALKLGLEQSKAHLQKYKRPDISIGELMVVADWNAREKPLNKRVIGVTLLKANLSQKNQSLNLVSM